MPVLGLPIVLLPFICPSMVNFRRLFPLRICPIHFFFRLIIVFISVLSSLISINTSSPDFLSVHSTSVFYSFSSTIAFRKPQDVSFLSFSMTMSLHHIGLKECSTRLFLLFFLISFLLMSRPILLLLLF